MNESKKKLKNKTVPVECKIIVHLGFMIDCPTGKRLIAFSGFFSIFSFAVSVWLLNLNDTNNI